MRDAQRPIATWVAATLAAKGWTAYRWSKETGGKVNAETIRRAVEEDYAGVTSLRVVEQLALAAGVSKPQLSVTSVDLVNEALICEILPVVLAAMGYPQPASDDLVIGARLLKVGLDFLQSNPEVADDPARMRFAMLALNGSGAPKA
jgi:hypothetical protein